MISYIKKVFRGEIPLLKGDRILWGIYFIFVVISTLEVFSASGMVAYEGNIWQPIRKHLLIVFVSSLGAIFASHLPWKRIKDLHWWVYTMVLLLLIATFLFGVKENDAQRSIIVRGISIQPSEFLKPAIVLIAAYLFGGKHNLKPRVAFWLFWGAVLLPTIPTALESGSSGVIILIMSWLICYVSNPPKREFRRITLLGVAMASIAFLLLVTLPENVLDKVGRSATWQSRLKGNQTDLPDDVYNAMSKAEKDSMNFVIGKVNYQRKHAQIAISRGGSSIIGVLPGNSLSRDHLPEAHNDFIYAIIIEELGPILGVLLVPLLFIFFYFRLGAWGKKAPRKQERLILYGFGLLYVFQALLNLSVASGLMPLTGQTLPLISTGGTSYLAVSICYGLAIALTSIIKDENELLFEKKQQREAAALAASQEVKVSESR